MHLNTGLELVLYVILDPGERDSLSLDTEPFLALLDLTLKYYVDE